jgi:hypothetical protein
MRPAVVVLGILLIASCATRTRGPTLDELRQAYQREHSGECALREEAGRRRHIEQEQDHVITYNASTGDVYAQSSRLKDTAKRVGAALDRVRQRLAACTVGDVDDLDRWTVTFSIDNAAFTAHDPETARCVSAVVGSALSALQLEAATQVAVVLGARDPGPHETYPRLAIRDAFRARMPLVRACYEAALLGWPDLVGTIRTKFVIAADGHVQISAVADSTLNHKWVECCVLNVVDGTRFPPDPNKGIVVVTYPFVLEQTNKHAAAPPISPSASRQD